MQELFIISLNAKVMEIKPGIINLLNTIKLKSKGNLFADLKLITDYVLPKLNTLAAIEQQLSELNSNYESVRTEKQRLDDELRNKIGEITGLNKLIADKIAEIDLVNNQILNKNLELEAAKMQLREAETELMHVKAEKQVLMQERNVLITNINNQIVKLNDASISPIDKLEEIPPLLIKIVSHLKATNESDAKLFNLIDLICHEYFTKIFGLDFSFEINDLSKIIDMLRIINEQINSKVETMQLLIDKYSDLFSSNLLFEENMSKLDDMLGNYLLLLQFKEDIKNLVN